VCKEWVNGAGFVGGLKTRTGQIPISLILGLVSERSGRKELNSSLSNPYEK